MELENLKNVIEMPISSQAFSKGGWKLVKKFKDEKNNYYALIECEFCRNQKLVNYYNFIDKNRKQRQCIQCKYQRNAEAEIGNIYGTTKILSIDHINVEKRSDGKGYKAGIYFETQCIKCGKTSVKLFNKTNWKNADGCPKCNASFSDSFYNRFKNDYKCNARERGIEWNLSDSKFIKIIHEDCYYCGEKPTLRKARNIKTTKYVNGIDRIDSSKGYSDDNCVSCCSMCNLMKNNYSVYDFLNHINKISSYQKEKEGSTTISKESTPKLEETEGT